jgi:hypothetical protein
MRWSRYLRPVIGLNATGVAVIAIAGLIYPAVRTALDLRDPALRAPGVPGAAWRLFASLTPRYADWARERVTAGKAEVLSTADISGTEWPLFGSVFFLWGVENLQVAWSAGDRAGRTEPRVYAHDAIVAASELVVDPRHAAWVRRHWGEDHLHRENVFYRMLVIGALTSRAKLLHDGAHLDLLRDQVETLAAELDASKTGLLDDYPGQCFPGDVMAALMCIQRADEVVGMDHRAMIARSLRAFTGANATSYRLPPYAADARSGWPMPVARGCANSYMGLTAPELWPAQAQAWFARHDELFWREGFMVAAFREFPKDITHREWWMDVDAGPVLAGVGVSASAFGVGAARKNGRFDRAYPLAAEMLALRWELPSGALVLPRMLSNLSDAPLLGEAAILWQLSVQPQAGFSVTAGGTVPGMVYLVIVALLGVGGWTVLEMWRRIARLRGGAEPQVWEPGFQLSVWAACLTVAAGVAATGYPLAALGLFLVGSLVPRENKKTRGKRMPVTPP